MDLNYKLQGFKNNFNEKFLKHLYKLNCDLFFNNFRTVKANYWHIEKLEIVYVKK